MHRKLGDSQCAAFDLREKRIQLRDFIQRSCSRAGPACMNPTADGFSVHKNAPILRMLPMKTRLKAIR
jgi:hypothetical protein